MASKLLGLVGSTLRYFCASIQKQNVCSFHRGNKRVEVHQLNANVQFWEYISVEQAAFLLSVLYTGDAGSCLRGGRDPFLFWKLPWNWKLFSLVVNYLDNDCFCHHRQRLLPCRLCNKSLCYLCSCVSSMAFVAAQQFLVMDLALFHTLLLIKVEGWLTFILNFWDEMCYFSCKP